MSIVEHDDWDLSEKGKKDAERHHEKIDDAIRKNVRDVIAEESIITKKKGRKVKIPVRGLKDYRFVHGQNDGGAGGVGQGEGEAGDIIDQKQKQQDGEPGKPGKDDRGMDVIEAEVDIDYLIDIMFEDLGLPYLEEKTRAHTIVPKGWKFEAVTKKGILPRLHKKRTMMAGIKRQIVYIGEIQRKTDCIKEDAQRALRQCRGDVNEAIKIIKENRLTETRAGVKIEDDDLRYKQIEPDIELQSQAAVICMMDVSGSMTTDKKYLARSMLFWLTEFLKKVYDNVEIKFIVHTTEAYVVNEHDFFHKMESGGTQASTAFEKANWIIDTEYPPEEWNVYCVYISDGEDWDPKVTVGRIKEMLQKNINMLSYVEIKLDSDSGYSFYDQTLIKEITNNWKFAKRTDSGTEFYKNDEKKFLLSIIKNRDHVFPALKHMLFEKKK